MVPLPFIQTSISAITDLKFFLICALLLLVFFGECESIENDEEPQNEKRFKELSDLTLAVIENSISAGASLADTTVGALQKPGYSVAVSGSIENYLKWTLRFKECEIATGYMNVPMRNVAPAKREGFAGHKSGGAAKGSWIRCAFTANGTMIHFMYSAPYSFDFHTNWLGFALCPANDSTCTSLTAKNMYYDSNRYIARREYYNNIRTLKKCFRGICVIGVMGTNHRPEIDIKVMPTCFDNLSKATKDSSAKERWSREDYEDLIENE